ncbi:hypothetical protein DITRI_Ditri16bG0029300 [Diplodiscus trichospermus]
MGHKATAFDMAASGIHPKQVDEIHSFADYFEPLMAFMASLPPDEKPYEKVMLVRHSLGGLCISIATERFPKKSCYRNICHCFYARSITHFLNSISTGPDSAIDYGKNIVRE